MKLTFDDGAMILYFHTEERKEAEAAYEAIKAMYPYVEMHHTTILIDENATWAEFQGIKRILKNWLKST